MQPYRVANEAEGRAEALRRIAHCRETQSEDLDLGGLMLTTFRRSRDRPSARYLVFAWHVLSEISNVRG